MEVIDTLANILFVVIIANFACLFLAKNENRKGFIWNREIVIAIMIVAISPLIYRMLQTDEVVQTEILVLRSIVCLLLFILSFILVAGECLIERRKNKFSGGEYRALLLMGIMLLCNDKVLALCVVDSDRKYGGRQVPLGGTAQKMKDTIKEINKQQKTDETLYELCCIPVHEAENLIPIAVLKAIEKDVPTMEAGVLYLQKMIQAGHSDAVLLYDFKNGGKRIKEDKDHQKKDWVREALPYWNGLSKEINDYSMPGLCKGLLEKAINALNNPNEGSYFESVEIDDYLKVHWAEIGRKVFTWGCAKKPDYI